MNRIIHRKNWVLFICFSGLLFSSVSFVVTASAASQEQRAQELELQDLELQDLELKYEELKKQIKQNKRAAKKSMRKMKKQQQALRFRGFFSAGVATTDGKAVLRLMQENQEIGDEPNFQSDAIVGLQLDARINDRTRYTHQMSTAGFDINHTVKTEWAYFSYKLTED
ncbi:MAG: hypothetical protein JKY67_11635, partial [Pseudomonadales bacterium]|nr:hypothetical protein [Pseudomonadales bacterium]